MKSKISVLLSLFLSLTLTSLQAQNGNVLWEKFKPTPATFSLISSATNPTTTQVLTSLDAPLDVDDGYGARIRGYIVPAQTGLYTFYIASDDQSELWLSPGILPTGSVKLCNVTAWTSHFQWEKETSQMSAPIQLDAGNYYYFEALMMEGSGGDNLSVGWKTPGSSVIELIGTAFISSEAVVDSSLAEITSFSFNNLGVPASGIINEAAGTIQVNVPFGTNLASLSPTIKYSYGASINPLNGIAQDFSSPVQYTVTSANAEHTKIYTVTAVIDAPRTINTVTLPVLVFPQVSINGIVNDLAGTIGFDIYSGLAEEAVLNYSKDYFATGSIVAGTSITFSSAGSLEITAQDGTKKTYTLIYNYVPGVAGFSDDYANNNNLPAWLVLNWNNSGTGTSFIVSHEPADENLKITKTTSTNDYIRFTFPENLNLGLVSPKVRLKVKSASALSSFGAKLQDAEAPTNDGNFNYSSQNLSMTVAADGQFHEAIWDFTGKMGAINPFLVKYLVLSVDRTISVALSDVRIDNFRVGVDAYANKKPLVNPIAKPDWAYTADGAQLVGLSGISDGNPEREETISITATSSNQAVVADGNISITYDGTSATAQLSYTGTSNGTSIITVTLKDNKGTSYSDETDSQSVTFVAEFRDATPGVNDAAVFGSAQFTHYNVGAGHQHAAIISGVDDGDQDMVQKLTFGFINNAADKVTIDSISYISGNSYALLYFHDKGITGNANVTVSCIDEADELLGKTPFSMSFDIPLGIYETFGVNYGATQVAQWQPVPYKSDPVYKEGYPKIFPSANIVNDCTDDFFWGRMWGYIIAPVSGTYKFYSNTEGEGLGNFYLSTNASQSGLPAVGSPTALNGQASSFITLEAGKAYYFEAYHCEIVNDYFLRLEWVYPGIASPVTIQQPYLFSMLDLVLPTTPANLRLVKKGSNQALVQWDASTDNLKLKGYYVYVNGLPYNTEVIKSNSLLLENLEPETEYDVFVIAEDQLKNSSKPSSGLKILTWGTDTNPPTAPTNLVISAQTAFSMSLSWEVSTDNETEVFGYNIYINGSSEPANTQAIIGNSYKVTGLDVESSYTISVTAIDASLNESAPATVSGNTTAFIWNDASEDAYIGKVSLGWDALVPSTGFAIEGDYGLSSVLVSNKISHNSFEGPAFINNMNSTSLTAVDKAKSAGVSYYAETASVYHGKKAARLEVGPGDWFRNQASIVMTPSYNYLVKFAAKKDASYNGTITAKVYRDIGGVVTAYTGTITPTTEWAMYEMEFPGILDASGSWYLEFSFSAMGTLYLDDVQLHIKEWYDPESKFSKAGLALLDELKPAAVRWGAIDANYENFSQSVGPYQQSQMTLGDFAALGARYNGYALLTVGVNSATDWKTTPNTFKNFIEYLAGPAGTTWGDVRISEGYTQPFDEVLKGIVIEMGNEVWGFDAHGANAFSATYDVYAPWARDMSKNYIKASPYYNPEKMWVALSGRSPSENYGLHASLIKGDAGEMDMMGISGYLGGNLNYDPAIDPGESQLDYHKNSYTVFYNNLKGLENVTKEMLQTMGRKVPMYMYEGNLTTNEYHGTVGQAVSFADYYASVMEYGVALPDVFCLEGGQWRILDNNINFKKRPLYYMVQYFNQFCAGGVMLKTNYQSVDKIYDYTGVGLKLNSVGTYFFNNDDKYGLALFSRDFENDYAVQVDLPDDIGTITDGEMVIVSGGAFNSLDATVVDSVISVTDGMIVNIPKYSAIFIRFKADSRTFDPMPALGEFTYQKVESIDLYTEDGSTLLDAPKKIKRILYTVNPEDAFYQGVKFDVIENSANASFALNRNVKADGFTNGTITVRATALDNSGVTSDITFTVTNQAVGIENTSALFVDAYPNPVKERMYLELGGEASETSIKVRNVLGTIVYTKECHQGKSVLELGELKSGLYFMEVSSKEGSQIIRFVKQ